MPTQAKIDKVAELKDKLGKCSIAITAGYTGIPVNSMTELRQRMRGVGIEFIVVKNSLLDLAAEAAHRPQVKSIVEGPTAVAFGYADPVEVAKTISDYIRTSRSTLAVRGAVLGDGAALNSDEVNRLATLPPKAQLVANLLGQLQAPLQRLLGIMNAPGRSFAGILQARMHQLESGEATG